MEEIKEFMQVDFSLLFFSMFIVLVGIKSITSIFEWVINKLGLETKWMRKKREEHDLLIQTSKNLAAFQEEHAEDVRQSIIHDNRIKEDLSVFMDDMKNTVSKTQMEIKQFAENRLRDREQSLKIQKELTESIRNIAESNSTKDKQIGDLMAAQREVLADKINEKYKYYISIKGIPEDEVDEFTNLHTAYKGVGGNHSGDAKFEYCINHLHVIPVETKLVMKE